MLCCFLILVKHDTNINKKNGSNSFIWINSDGLLKFVDELYKLCDILRLSAFSNITIGIDFTFLINVQIFISVIEYLFVKLHPFSKPKIDR